MPRAHARRRAEGGLIIRLNGRRSTSAAAVFVQIVPYVRVAFRRPVSRLRISEPECEHRCAGHDADVLLAVHRIGDRSGRNGWAETRLPEQSAGARIEREE